MPEKDLPKYNNHITLEDRAQNKDRLFSPSAGRNKAVIATNLAELLPDSAKVLEIASGTGEHGAELYQMRPDVMWQYSDPDPQSRRSQMAWAAYIDPDGNCLIPPLNLDMCKANWTEGLGQYSAIFAANMIHIAPWEAALGLAAGGEQILTQTGTIWLYGPFLDGGASAPSNLAFDNNLKQRNSAWGVRSIDSVKHIFAKHGFNHVSRRDLPKNNLLLGFSR